MPCFVSLPSLLNKLLEWCLEKTKPSADMELARQFPRRMALVVMGQCLGLEMSMSFVIKLGWWEMGKPGNESGGAVLSVMIKTF